MSEEKGILGKTKDEVVSGMVKSMAAGILLVGASFIQPVKEVLFSPWVAAESVKEIKVDLEQIKEDIRILKRPSDIFEVNEELSRTTTETCMVGSNCTIELWVRRLEQARDCMVVGTGVEHWVVTVSDSTQRRVQRVNRPSVYSNVGTSWEPILIEVEIPASVSPGDAFYVVIIPYSGCPNSEEGEIVRDEGEPIFISLTR